MRNLIWLASFPKSGSTWTRLFIAAYLSGAESIDLDRVGDYSRSESLLALFAKIAGKESADLTEEDIEEHRMAVQERLARNIGQRVVKTHNARLARDHRRLVFSRYTKAAVYIVRNPLDVVDSWADHINRTLDETIDLMNQSRHRLRATKTHASQYVGTWTHHVRTWMNNKNEFPRIVLRYEDLKENPMKEFGRLVKFLGWNYDEVRLRRAIELTDFQVVQNAELEQGFTETSDVARSGRFFRYGEPGRWRDVLSPDQIAKVIENHGDAMREAGYEISELLVAAGSSGRMPSTQSDSTAVPPAKGGIDVNLQATHVRSYESQISPSWKKWIAENVLRDNDRDNLAQILVAEGISEQVARQEVDSAASHPYVDAARSLGRQIKKRDWVFDTMRLLQNEDKSWAVERRKGVGHEEFSREYYFRNRPVILTDALDGWAAIQRWTPDYLKGRCGDQMVQVQVRRESNPRYEIENQSHKSTIRFSDYVDQVFAGGSTNDYYMTANNGGANRDILPALRDDFDMLPNYLDPAIADERVFFWFGPAGTVTPVHHDLTNNFMAQVVGRKQIRLISPLNHPNLYNNLHCYSEVDLDNIDLDRHPQFRHVKIHEITIHPGELFFLPVGWWHQVRGLDVSITLTCTNFRARNDFASFYETYGEI